MVFFMIKNKIFIVIALTVVMAAAISSCGIEKISKKKLKDLEYVVLSENEIPDIVRKTVDEKKDSPFKITYSDPESTYIMVGYGKQDYKGYSIKVADLYETSNGVYIKTEFKGPEEYTSVQMESYPYIVIKIEYTDKNIIFSE